MKKVLAAVLAFAMVVTGMYFVKPEASEVKAATTVPADMLDIKLQAIGGANKTMRLITSVDSLDYKEVGFIVNNGTDEKKMSTTTVFEKIKSSVEGETYNFSPKLIGSSSEYFATVKFDVAYPDNTYTVQAYVITNDDQEIKGREIRSFQYNDGTATTTVNLLVEGTLEQGVTATYGPNADGTGDEAASVTVLTTNDGYTSVRVALEDGTTVDDLKSATRFTFSDGSTAVYRNYYTTHKNPADTTTCTTAVADTSWYDVDPNATSFIIASSADLYGLASVVNSKADMFQNDTVTLVCDVVVNEGTAVKYDSSSKTKGHWVPDAGLNSYQWTPIGFQYGDYGALGWFDGTFDGDNNEISGIYLSATSGANGLFGFVGKYAQLKNFKLTNSFFTSTAGGSDKNNVAAITGSSYGLLYENIYTNAVVLANGGGVAAGFAGYMATSGKGTPQCFKNCWFDGEVFVSKGQAYSSVFVGYLSGGAGTIKMSNCMFSGHVAGSNGAETVWTHTGNYYGGLIGYASASDKTITIDNCLILGKLTVYQGMKGSIIGSLSGNAGTLNHVYEAATLSSPTLTIKYDNASHNTNTVFGTESGRVEIDTLTDLSNTQLLAKFPLLAGETECAWIVDNTTGTPILKSFATWYYAQ